MKRLPGLMTCVVLLLSCTLLSSQDLQPVDRISNGGFEDGVVGWQADAQHERIVDPEVAHRGKACLSGEVTQPNQALRLRRNIVVRAGHRYRFDMWARATNRTKLVLWAVLPGDKQRTMIASWTNVTRKWQRFTTPIAVTKTGMLELEIIAPSSYGAPIGRMWLDDVSLIETPMPPVLDLSLIHISEPTRR